MTRLFLILAIVFLAILLWRSLLGKLEARNKSNERKPIAHNMIRCDYCGLHVPEDTIVRLDGRCYCSNEHKALHNKARNSQKDKL
ncbi:MAG: PP0621 family protein [Gammaproteobacteria bacterium]